MSPNHLALAALCCSLACSSARAERFRVGDDSDTEAGDCQLDLSIEQRRSTAEPALRESALALDCGIGWQTELSVSLTRQRSAGSSERSLGIEGRTVLPNSGPAGLGWALVYGVDGQRGSLGGWQRSGQFIGLESGLQLAPWLRVELKVESVRDHRERRHASRWTFGVEQALGDAVELRAEWGAQSGQRPAPSLSVRWAAWPDVAALTLNWSAPAGPARERRAGAGLSFEF